MADSTIVVKDHEVRSGFPSNNENHNQHPKEIVGILESAKPASKPLKQPFSSQMNSTMDAFSIHASMARSIEKSKLELLGKPMAKPIERMLEAGQYAPVDGIFFLLINPSQRLVKDSYGDYAVHPVVDRSAFLSGLAMRPRLTST